MFYHTPFMPSDYFQFDYSDDIKTFHMMYENYPFIKSKLKLLIVFLS